MALDVEIPDPPALSEVQNPGDYEAVEELSEESDHSHRRSDLADFLHDGAWETAFEEWVERTDVSEAGFEAVRDLGLIDEFDFYWNPSAEDVGYRAPSLPRDLPSPHDERVDPNEVELIDEELDALGRTVSEVLENDYIHRDGDEFGYDWE